MDRVREEIRKIMNEPGRQQSAQRVETALKRVAQQVAQKAKEKQQPGEK